MYKIRRGKDFKVIWSFFDCDGNPYTLRKEYLALFVKSSFSNTEVTDFSVEENKIIWVFKGKDQKNLGDYSLELFTDNGEDGMIPVDSVDAFTLVQYSKDESNCTCDFLKVEDVSLKSDLDIESMYILANFQEQLDKKADKKDVDTAINTKAEEIYSVTSAALAGLDNSINQKLSAKVDKVSGKQLSTEDFTTALKQKLQSLNNYDDSALSSAINSLQNQINTLVSGNASSAIDTFNEIIAFLNGVKDTQDLAGIIASIEQQIASVNNSLSAELAKKPNKTELAEQEQKLTELSSEIDALITEVESQNEMIEGLQNTKIDKEADDYYPHLSVGLADNLVGVDVVDSSFAFRRSGGGAIADGNARIETIKGNSLVWNQLINNVADTTGLDGWWVRTGSSVTINGSKIEQVVTDTTRITQIAQNVNFKENHKYLVTFDVNVVSDVENIFLDIIQSSNLYGNTQKKIGNITQKEAQFATIYTADASMPYFSIFHNVSLNEGDITTFDGIKVIDLTLMFGVGNEPRTIEEAYARMPIGVDLNAYNEREVISLNADSLVSRGFNQWDEEWEVGYIDDNGNVAESPNYIRSKNFIPIIPGATYYIHSPNIKSNIYLYDSTFKYLGKITKANIAFDIPRNAAYIKFRNYNPEYGVVYKNDLCINLSDPSKDGTYEPYIKRTQSLSIIGEGLKSVGTSHDEIRYNKATQKWEKVQRVCSVDMGSLNWSYEGVSESYPHGFFYTNINTDLRDKSIGSKVLCPLYASGGFKDDKSIASNVSNNMLYVRDSSYTDAESFKAAMAGVILYYELAEPIVTELDDDFNLDYEVWNGGTEEVISDMPTTPLKADIAYGFNAVGKIKDLEDAISNLPSGESSVFKAIYGVTTYEEIKAAYDSGKVVHCDFNNLCYTLVRIIDKEVYFNAVRDTYSYYLYCKKSDKAWVSLYSILEGSTNKVTSLSDKSTDTQYPSAKAVYDAVSKKSEAKEGVIRQRQVWSQAADMGYDYTITDVVRGAIPQANIDLLASVGIVFNAGSGYFELNGMTDLSYEEAMEVYSKTNAFSQGCISASGVGLGGVMEKKYGYFRCNVPMLPYRLYMMTQANFSYLCWSNRFIERLFLYNYNAVFVKDLASAFDGCYRLKEVQGVIELKNSATNYTSAFLNCYSLESISLQGIKANLNFAQSARLGNASILFMINKEVATSAITITLHADAYARAMADAEITAALAAHPNVSLAKA